MSAFSLRNGVTHCEGVALPALAKAVGTPLYVYSRSAMVGAYSAMADAFAAAGCAASVHYAVKANPNLAVVAALAACGAGADVVSEGEIRRALAGGIPADRIIFSGVGKTSAEMAFALDVGVRQFNVESGAELAALAAVARDKGAVAPVALRINPDVDAGTHAKITTGTAENKFGVPLAEVSALYAEAARVDGLRPVGLAIHIGSLIPRAAPFETAWTRLRDAAASLRAAGYEVARLDLGGGYAPAAAGVAAPADFAAAAARVFRGFPCELAIEPGRALVADAGVLLTQVIYVKRGGAKRFVIVDAAMNDLLRPTLYEAHHDIRPVRALDAAPGDAADAGAPAAGAPEADAELPADIVGPVCESGDYLGRGRALGAVARGDFLAVMGAGAYGAAMASQYNARPLIPEVLVDGDHWDLVRRRPDFAETIALESIPARISDTIRSDMIRDEGQTRRARSGAASA